MRLSTATHRDDDHAIAVLHAALDAGVRLLDTADAYAHDDGDRGHNERLVARALASWSSDATAVQIATKGGLTRPRGAWMPDGRAKHLIAACEASLVALGRSCIDLYQLHAPDPYEVEHAMRARRANEVNVSAADLERASVKRRSDGARKKPELTRT
jgi:aryl-alcohol dehydrogenase-like predicted oxidoreductase